MPLGRAQLAPSAWARHGCGTPAHACPERFAGQLVPRPAARAPWPAPPFPSPTTHTHTHTTSSYVPPFTYPNCPPLPTHPPTTNTDTTNTHTLQQAAGGGGLPVGASGVELRPAGGAGGAVPAPQPRAAQARRQGCLLQGGGRWASAWLSRAGREPAAVEDPRCAAGPRCCTACRLGDSSM